MPQEFTIACTVYKLDVQEVLQVFIDHAIIYDSIGNGYSKGFSESSKTIGKYVVGKKLLPRRSDAYKHCLDSTAYCFKHIADLSNKKTGTANAKRKKTLPFVNKLYETMKRVYTNSDTFYRDGHQTLKLSKDFTILCELLNCYPAEYLEYFMGRISIADM